MSNPADTIESMARSLLVGMNVALLDEVDTYAHGREAAPDVLSVAAFAALLADRPLAARTLASRACAARSSAAPKGEPENVVTLEDATVAAWDLAAEARFSSATDVLRQSLRVRAASTQLVPLIAAARFDVLIRAATEADIAVWDSSTRRLLVPEEVRQEATEQVRSELSMCMERCLGTPEAPRMARELVRIGTRCGNTNGNWGHVFATVARTIDHTVERAETLLLS